MRLPLATLGTILPFTMKPSGALKLIAQLVMRGEVKVCTADHEFAVARVVARVV